MRLPFLRVGHGRHPAGRLAPSGRCGPHQYSQHPGCQLAVAARQPYARQPCSTHRTAGCTVRAHPLRRISVFSPFGIRSFRLRVPFFAFLRNIFSAAESAAFTLFPSSVRSYSLVRSRFVHKGIIFFFAASLVIFIQICYNSDNISSAFGRISRVKGAFPLWIIHIRAPC